MEQRRKAVWGWALYDWANSAFATTVMAGFFPVFFKSYWSAGADVNASTALLGMGNSVASLFVALMAPVLGAVADKGTARKKFMIFYAYLGVLMTAGLYFVGQGQWAWAIFIYAMGCIGFSGANVFYDSLLPSVAGEKEIDYVSGLGFSMGYLGGGLLFLVNVIMVQKPELFGLADAAMAVRLSFLSVAVWWGLFTLITIAWVPDTPPPGGAMPLGRAVSEGLKQLRTTLGRIRHLKTVALFLVAYWFYIDGVDTIVRMSIDYGMSIGFESSDLILALLMVQFVGFPAALLFGWLGQRWSVRKAIYLAIALYIGITIWGTQMSVKWEFYLLAGFIGLVQGGIQALSRSYYSRLIPKDKPAEYYGFYNMLGKFAAILGPVLMGLAGLMVRRILMPPDPTAEQLVAVGQHAARWGLASIILLFLVGGILFFFVDEDKGRAEAAYLTEKD